MNERIRELIEQAEFEENDGHISIQGVYMFNTARMEKFAELIVRDVVEQIIIRERNDGEWYQHDIFKHFGVEE
jgi:hypothetical protein